MPECLVYEACVQKTAEATLTATALATVPGLTALPLTIGPTGQILFGGFPATVEVSIPINARPAFTPTAGIDKVVDCGFVPAMLLIAVSTVPTPTTVCIPVNLSFEEIEEVPGALPGDLITERLVQVEATAVCPAFVNITTINEPAIVPKVVMLVQKRVTREFQEVLPPCQEVCPPDTMARPRAQITVQTRTRSR